MLALTVVSQSTAFADEQLFDRFYVGAGVNASRTEFNARHDTSELPDDPEWAEFIKDKSDSSTGGYIQIGKDWQLNNTWVVGVVFDYSKLNSDVIGREADTPQTEYIKFESDYMMSLRGKLGYLITERTMVYGTAGVATYKAKFTNYNDLGYDPEIGSSSFRSTDFVFGAGVNWFTPYSDKVSVNLEALYFTGGDKKRFREDQLSSDTDNGDYAEINNSALVKLGLNYSF